MGSAEFDERSLKVFQLPISLMMFDLILDEHRKLPALVSDDIDSGRLFPLHFVTRAGGTNGTAVAEQAFHEQRTLFVAFVFVQEPCNDS